MKVTIRKRLKGKKESLYLDYYEQGVRKYEYLKLYLHPETSGIKLSKMQREENRVNLEMADAVRAKRIMQLNNKEFGLRDKDIDQQSFIHYFERILDSKSESAGTFGNWKSTLKHVKNFEKFDVSFKMINKAWLEKFQSYLKQKRLGQNTQISYFNKVVAVLNQAVIDGIIPINPVRTVSRLKEKETEREFLTIEELRSVFSTECELPDMKRAFIFSALTGLRWSDIIKLKWSDIQYTQDSGYFIRYKQKKTQVFETLPISAQAFEILGSADDKVDHESIFSNLDYSAWNNKKLKSWILKAGIKKNITFHCARHTYATLQLSYGTDIYTVSKLLGHKNLQTTQIYAKVVDQKKIDASKRIII